MTRSAILLAMLLPLSGPAASADLSGPAFLNGCQLAVRFGDDPRPSRAQETAAIFCIAYVTGLIEGMALKASHSSRFCIPTDLPRAAAFRTVVDAMRAEEAGKHGHGEIAVAATARAFPCSRR